MLQLMNCQNSAYRRYQRSWPNLLTGASFVGLVVMFSLGATAADDFQDLDTDQQERLMRLCNVVQLQSGTDAFRECLKEQSTLLKSTQDSTSRALTALPIDEQFAIQQACNNSAISPDNKAACISEQIATIGQQSLPDVSSLSTDEQYVVAQQCFEAQSTSGISAYRDCITGAMESVEALPAAQFTNRTATARSNIQLECSQFSDDVASYRKCVLTALGVAFNDQAVPDVAATTATAQVDSANGTSPGSDSPRLDSAPAVIPESLSRTRAETASESQPTPNNPASVDTPAQSPALENNTSAISEQPDNPANTLDQSAPAATVTENASIMDRLQQQLNKVQTRVAALSPMRLIALFATLAVAFLVIGLTLMRKPVKRLSGSRNTKNLMAGSRRRRKRTHTSTATDLAPIGIESETADGNNSAARLNDVTENHAHTSIDSQYDQRTLEAPFELEDFEDFDLEDTDIDSDIDNDTASRQFSAWLNDFPMHTRQEFSIELLIYWTAYADNRFDPELKRQVLLMNEPDDRSLIKRWAFLKDAHALSDAIAFLQKNTEVEQREQIIDLLMALLINEQALTPIQNNLLRFLSDAFGIGSDGLNRQYKRAYGSDIPPVPRPDKMIWWNTITADQQLRWDARAIAIQPDNIRYRISLGQPLKGELNREAIVASFNLSAQRCHHSRVAALGEREQALMSTQQKKFEIARNALLELVS